MYRLAYNVNTRSVNMRVLYTDINRCTGCKTCITACATTRSKWKKGESISIKVESLIPRNFVINSNDRNVPLQCKHCEEAPCLAVCPVDAIYKKDNLILLSQCNCIGCSACSIACPYGNIIQTDYYMEKCNLCHEETDSACSIACPNGALISVNFDKLTKKREGFVL